MMYLSFKCFTIFFVAVACQNYGLFHFSQSQKNLLQCIENHDTFKSINVQHQEDIRAIKIVADLVAEKFYRKTVTREELNYIQRLINSFRQRRFPQVRADNEIPWELLEQSLYKAIRDCSDEYERDISNNLLEAASHQTFNRTIKLFLISSRRQTGLANFWTTYL